MYIYTTPTTTTTHTEGTPPLSTEFWKIVRLFLLFFFIIIYLSIFFFCFSNVMSNEWSLANIDVRKIKSWSITTPDKDTCKLFRRRSYKRMIIRHAEDSEILANPQMAYNEINCWRWWCKKMRSVVCTDIYK